MITHDVVTSKLDVLIAKANSLKTTLGPSGPAEDQYGDDVETRAAHTWYGLPEAIAEDIEKSISAIMVAEQKVLAIYS